MHTEDGYFIQKCLLGEPGAFSFLIEKYKTAVYSLAYSKLGNFHDAQDIAQEAFVKAYRKLSTLKRTDKFRPWIYAITSNLCIDFLRSQSSRPDSEYAEDIDEDILEQPAISAYQKELNYDALREALGELPEIYRQVISLYYLGDMKSKEIAQFLGTSVTNINARLSRARVLLKEEMIVMMSTTFDEVRLQPGFTFRVVEAVKRTKIQSAPYKPALPFSISATGIMIALMLSMTIPQSPLYPIGELIGSALLSQTQVSEIGVIPVDTVEVTEITILTSEKEDGDFGQKPKPKPTNFAGAGKWERKADMPIGTFGARLAHVGDSFYVIGGAKTWGTQTDVVEVYDSAAETWAARSKMLTPRYNHATCVLNGKIYAVGGWNGGALSTVEMYDPIFDRWERKANLPVAVLAHSASVVNGRIYVIGGYKNAQTTVPTVYEYTPEADTWTQKTDIPTARIDHVAGVVKEKIYVIGGSDQQRNPLKTVEVYDPATDIWMKGQVMPTARAAAEGTVVNGIIFVIGGDTGRDGNNPTAAVELYNPDTGEWKKGPSLQEARWEPAIGIRDGKIYVIGGATGPQKITSTIEELNLSSLGFPLSVSPSDKLTTTWGEMKAKN